MSRLSPEEITARLEAAFDRHFGFKPTIANLRRLTGGASRETWSFDIDADADSGLPGGLILRRDPGKTPLALERSTEAGLLSAAYDAGVPVPQIVCKLDDDDGLGPAFIMERIEGETIPRKILRDAEYAEARPKMSAQCGEILAKIHAINFEDLGLPAPGDAHPVDDQIKQYRQLLDGFGEPHPAFELGLKYLEESKPPLARLALVHGDFRNGNLIVGPDGIRSVLDWELAHIGDPLEDFGWLCVRSWRFGEDSNEVGGFGHLEDLCEAYEAAGGDSVSPESVRFWEIFGTVKWGVICIVQAFTHLNGLTRSVELATLGRRVCEMEYDVMRLLPW
ncbi:MAG: phosphotransferase family protein [Acidobacteria bacterium]|nr:MAG: phosphotransferase family protein [Acidobacteriota bacterium]